MPKPIARYSITSGLRGCYMPDSYGGAFECTTRRELMDAIRAEIEMMEWPTSAIRQVSARRLWSFIKRHGSSTAHFSITHGDYEIAFHGLTEEEYRQQSAEE
jgi:hypothetical protein